MIQRQHGIRGPGTTRTVRSRYRAVLAILLALGAAGCSLTGRAPPPLPAGHPAAIVASVASSMVGVPYRYGGATPAGFDCSGLVYYAHQQAGINVPRTAADQRRRSEKVPERNLRPGDLLFFDTSWRSSHVGIYVGNGEFVHAPSSGKRVSRGSIKEGYFAKRLKQAGRLTGR
jgi:cell wall-associated NlpC family hydrolase